MFTFGKCISLPIPTEHFSVFLMANFSFFVLLLLCFFVNAFNSVSYAQNQQPAAEVAETLPEQAINPPSVNEVASQFISLRLSKYPNVIDQLLEYDDPEVGSIFTKLLAGELYYVKETEQLVHAIKQSDDNFNTQSIFSPIETQENIEKYAIKKIKTTNKVRKKLRIAIAFSGISHPQVKRRVDAVKTLMASMSPDVLNALKQAKLNETNTKVKNKLTEAIAFGELSNDDALVRFDAVETLGSSLEPVVRAKLESLSKSDQSDEVKQAAINALKSIDAKVKFSGYLERIFFGLSLGSILLLVAAGLAITFGVMGVINMAHGELIMLGAYTTYVVQLLMPNHLEYSLFVAIPAAFIVSGLFGIAIERGVIQFLKGRPLETLLATFGISLILQQLVRTVFSPLNRQVITPEFMSGALEISPVLSITYNRIYIFFFAIIVFFLLQFLMKKTVLGLNVRAVSQNRNMARSMGVRSEWVDAMTFGLGSGVAGLAGVALSQITNVGPNLGQSYIIDSFMVVVFGGVGNLWGTLVGAFMIGALNKFLEPVTGTVLATIIVLVFIILFIQKKPRGLFPQKGRAAES